MRLDHLLSREKWKAQRADRILGRASGVTTKDVRKRVPQRHTNNWLEARYDLIVLLDGKVLYRFEGSETKLHIVGD